MTIPQPVSYKFKSLEVLCTQSKSVPWLCPTSTRKRAFWLCWWWGNPRIYR
jgi:hypothetical protein